MSETLAPHGWVEPGGMLRVERAGGAAREWAAPMLASPRVAEPGRAAVRAGSASGPAEPSAAAGSGRGHGERRPGAWVAVLRLELLMIRPWMVMLTVLTALAAGVSAGAVMGHGDKAIGLGVWAGITVTLTLLQRTMWLADSMFGLRSLHGALPMSRRDLINARCVIIMATGAVAALGPVMMTLTPAVMGDEVLRGGDLLRAAALTIAQVAFISLHMPAHMRFGERAVGMAAWLGAAVAVSGAVGAVGWGLSQMIGDAEAGPMTALAALGYAAVMSAVVIEACRRLSAYVYLRQDH
ncbi:ABC-2 transporter permease [Actinomyces slackii]|uniref:ABC-2 family transporter protein n=1 Tax=Actinomyces slackii TaxID=52774 RepID=A0A3S4WG09_9ACTO|nr:hypothetical protein [Actinomyces slackii]VEG74139.1 Uncharacterised protein [Actinomyces slackii]